MASATQLITACQYYIFVVPYRSFEYLPLWQNQGYNQHLCWIPSLWVVPYYFLPTLLRDFSAVTQKTHQGLEKLHRLLLLLLDYLFSHHNALLKYLNSIKNSQNSMWSKISGYQTRKWFPLPGMKRQVGCSALKKKKNQNYCLPGTQYASAFLTHCISEKCRTLKIKMTWTEEERKR